MQVAEVVVKILESEGIEAAFGIPGAAINPVYKYLGESKQISHYTARHEEGAVHAADGYYRASGKMAMAICTSGPAATNFVTGLYTAQIDSMPLIAITGNANVAQFGKEAFQCVPIAEIAKPVVKASYCVTDPSTIVEVMQEAFRVAREGRPGPVLIDLPLDVQMAETEFDPAAYQSLTWKKPEPDVEKIDAALDLIMSAREPIVIMGGGVVLADACSELREFTELLSLPVVTTYMAKGGLPENHPLHVGHIGIQVGQPFGNKFFLGTDVVLGIGCRFTDRHTGALEVYRGERKFIHIDIEPTQIGRVFEPDLGIVADAKLAINALIERARARGLKRQPTEATKRIPVERPTMARKTDYDDHPIKAPRVYAELNEFFDGNTLFYTGCGLTQIWSGQLQEIDVPRRYLASGGAGTLGYEVPAAIGGKVARPDLKSVAVVGDGGFMFMGEELAMAAHYNVPVIVVVVNNGYLSLIRQNQKYAYGFEHGTKLWYDDAGENMTDFVKFAEALGCQGERVHRAEDIAGALERAVAANCPYVIDIIVERETDCSMGGSIAAVREFE
ncbi:MAG: glyoxylate carboligase [Firmicutes bacterium]|jgi:tartronate-semialdehyde synthase|nr:glyoxylate carboligase [Bacillota bacterium]